MSRLIEAAAFVKKSLVKTCALKDCKLFKFCMTELKKQVLPMLTRPTGASGLLSTIELEVGGVPRKPNFLGRPIFGGKEQRWAVQSYDEVTDVQQK